MKATVCLAQAAILSRGRVGGHCQVGHSGTSGLLDGPVRAKGKQD